MPSSERSLERKRKKELLQRMIRVNLIPESLLAAQVRHRHLRGWSVATVAAIVLVAMPMGMDWVHHARAAELEEYSQHLQTEFRRVRADWHDLNEKATHLALRLERAQTLRSKRSWSGMLALVASCCPEQSWVTSIATDPVTPSGASTRVRTPRDDQSPPETVVLEAPRRLVVEGYAIDATLPNQFVTNLKETSVFSDVALERSTIQSISGGDYLRFEIVCEW